MKYKASMQTVTTVFGYKFGQGIKDAIIIIIITTHLDGCSERLSKFGAIERIFL